MNNKTLSKTLLFLALGSGYSYMKQYTDNLDKNQIENYKKEISNNNHLSINNIFDDFNNNNVTPINNNNVTPINNNNVTPINNNINNLTLKNNIIPNLYTNNERAEIFKKFKQSYVDNNNNNNNNTSNILSSNILSSNILSSNILSSNKQNFDFQINNLKIQYKIIIEFSISNVSLIPITLNNFKHIIYSYNTPIKNKIIFNNIIFDNNNNNIKLEFDEIEPIDYLITIKPSDFEFNNGILTINNNPFYFYNNNLPTTIC